MTLGKLAEGKELGSNLLQVRPTWRKVIQRPAPLAGPAKGLARRRAEARAKGAPGALLMAYRRLSRGSELVPASAKTPAISIN
jgi:hypothetical protein